MRGLLFFVFLALLPMIAKADYDPLKLYEMILGADKIVFGEIVDLDSGYYTLRVEGNLTGDEETLRIARFENWACAWRWKEYEIGQRVFLFLKDFEGILAQMDAGNEGELPLYDHSVFIKGQSLNSYPHFFPDSIKSRSYQEKGLLPATVYQVYGSNYIGYKAQLADFISTVSCIRSCFKPQFLHFGRLISVKPLCNPEILVEKAQKDEILKWVLLDIQGKIKSK